MLSPDERRLLMEKIEEWRRKARNETDPFNSYLSCFIAFNILYSMYAKVQDPNTDGARHDAQDALRIAETVSDEKGLVLRLSPALNAYLLIIPSFREEYWPYKTHRRRVALGEALKASYQEKNYKEVIEYTLKWLYKVRCNLVHGEKNYNDELQRRILRHCTQMLQIILDDLLTNRNLPRL